MITGKKPVPTLDRAVGYVRMWGLNSNAYVTSSSLTNNWKIDICARSKTKSQLMMRHTQDRGATINFSQAFRNREGFASINSKSTFWRKYILYYLLGKTLVLSGLTYSGTPVIATEVWSIFVNWTFVCLLVATQGAFFE